jgi:chromosomal replication initiator protein
MYLAKHLTEASLPEIGRQFGGKHHTTVLHSVDKIDVTRKTDKDLNRLINKMTEQLGGLIAAANRISTQQRGLP